MALQKAREEIDQNRQRVERRADLNQAKRLELQHRYAVHGSIQVVHHFSILILVRHSRLEQLDKERQAKEERLAKLRQQVVVHATSDPSRLLQPIASGLAEPVRK